jgi:very-short-patch-repair endonuclease
MSQVPHAATMQHRKIIPSNPHLKDLARELRNHSTLAEVLLWNQIKNKKLLGYDFHRQKPIDRFIVDFFCPDLMLAIEIDGASHGQKGLRRCGKTTPIGKSRCSSHPIRRQQGKARNAAGTQCY